MGRCEPLGWRSQEATHAAVVTAGAWHPRRGGRLARGAGVALAVVGDGRHTALAHSRPFALAQARGVVPSAAMAGVDSLAACRAVVDARQGRRLADRVADRVVADSRMIDLVAWNAILSGPRRSRYHGVLTRACHCACVAVCQV